MLLKHFSYNAQGQVNMQYYQNAYAAVSFYFHIVMISSLASTHVFSEFQKS